MSKSKEKAEPKAGTQDTPPKGDEQLSAQAEQAHAQTDGDQPADPVITEGSDEQQVAAPEPEAQRIDTAPQPDPKAARRDVLQKSPEAGEFVITTAVYTQLANNTERPIEVTQSFPKDMGRAAETHRIEGMSIQLVDHVTGATFDAKFVG